MGEKKFFDPELSEAFNIYIYIALKAMHLSQGVRYMSHTTATITKHFFTRKILANYSL